MCVDYTDLNKHCPKDPFGLPRIDELAPNHPRNGRRASVASNARRQGQAGDGG
jgi:hypothetical protein